MTTATTEDRFYRYDEYGNGLDPASARRREALRGLKQMSVEELFAVAVRAGIYNPDGTLTEPYRDDGEPSAHRPTD